MKRFLVRVPFNCLRDVHTCPNKQAFKTERIMGASRENRAINYWSKAYDAGWFGVDGVEVLIIFLRIVIGSTGATHSGFLVNTRRNADLFVGGAARLGPSDQSHNVIRQGMAVLFIQEPKKYSTIIQRRIGVQSTTNITETNKQLATHHSLRDVHEFIKIFRKMTWVVKRRHSTDISVRPHEGEETSFSRYTQG